MTQYELHAQRAPQGIHGVGQEKVATLLLGEDPGVNIQSPAVQRLFWNPLPRYGN